MSIKFATTEELAAYFELLDETIHDDERRLVLRGAAIAGNLFLFSQYRKQQARLNVAAAKTA